MAIAYSPTINDVSGAPVSVLNSSVSIHQSTDKIVINLKQQRQKAY